MSVKYVYFTYLAPKYPVIKVDYRFSNWQLFFISGKTKVDDRFSKLKTFACETVTCLVRFSVSKFGYEHLGYGGDSAPC